jgi:hypothetical protein
MRRLAFIWLLLAATWCRAEQTNYFCVVCGKGPLTGRIWISKWGAVCNDCYQLGNHCTICGLPVREDDPDAIRTGDGRFICKFDKAQAVLDAAQAGEIFTDARRGLIELFGSGFALKFPAVMVKLFDVDYWSEIGRPDGLHKFGFASTRRTPGGSCTHEVVLLSGRLRTELEAAAAHEYTHLWLNENRPGNHVIAGDTVEAICELAAYKLMQAQGQTNQMQAILANPYTHGEIKNLVALEAERGIGWILNWVKNGASATLENQPLALAAPAPKPFMAATNVAPPSPRTLKLGGLLTDGRQCRAIIGGESFAPDEVKPVKLRDRTVLVRCVKINADSVVIEVDGASPQVTLKMDATP